MIKHFYFKQFNLTRECSSVLFDPQRGPYQEQPFQAK